MPSKAEKNNRTEKQNSADAVSDKLRDSYLRQTFDLVDMAVFIIDAAGVFYAANRRFRDGIKDLYRVEYHDGLTLRDLFPSSDNNLEYEYWSSSLQQAAAAERFSIDHAVAAPGGMEYYLINTMRIADDEAGGTVLSVTIQNITKHKIIEEDANDAYDFIRKIVDLSVTGILTFNEAGECVSANAAASKILGLEVSALLKENFKSLRVFTESGIIPLAQDALATKNEHRISSGFESAPGVVKWAEFRIVPFTQKGNIHLLILISDETERRQIEDDTRHFMRELKRSNEELEQYTSLVSSEISEPLQSVRKNLESLPAGMEPGFSSDVIKTVSETADAVGKIQSIIDGILSYSQVMSGGGAFSECDLASVVESVLSQLSGMIAEARADIECGSLPSVHADAFQMSLLFQKLLENALSYTGSEKPKIKIGYHDKDSEWLFFVVDNGAGIEPNSRDEIFSLFSGGKKSGISLALCRRIVERHSGRIWVDSIAGRGSVFYFTIRK